MKNKMEDLRNHLFAALEGLADKDNPLDIERAKAISEVSKTVIDSARVEVQFMKLRNDAIGANKPQSPFIENRPALESIPGVSKQ